MFNKNENENIKLFEISYKEYYLMNRDILYKIKIEKNKENILLLINNYLKIINISNLQTLNKEFNSIQNAYEFLISCFENNIVFINDIKMNKLIKLIFKVSENNKIEIILLYKHTKINFINEIKKSDNLSNNISNNPNNIKLYINITNDSYAYADLDNSFLVFNSINNILYLIYSSINKSMICFDLSKNKKVIEIKNKDYYFTNYRHYLNKNNKRDLIMSLSWENILKIWDTYNWEIILNINKVNILGYLISGCFLYDNNQDLIITSNCNYEGTSEPIKIFDFNGNKIKEINDSKEKTLFIEVYYDEIFSKNFIISCNFNYIKSYNYQNNKLYNKYYDNLNEGHLSAVINKNKENIQLIESCIDGNIRIWDFHSALLLTKIKVSDKYLYGLCLWNEKYLFVGCEDKTIKLIDLLNKKKINSLIGNKNGILTVKKIIHFEYGESLICQGFSNDTIKLLINENNLLYFNL